jgi:hypothetical protein
MFEDCSAYIILILNYFFLVDGNFENLELLYWIITCIFDLIYFGKLMSQAAFKDVSILKTIFPPKLTRSER